MCALQCVLDVVTLLLFFFFSKELLFEVNIEIHDGTWTEEIHQWNALPANSLLSLNSCNKKQLKYN